MSAQIVSLNEEKIKRHPIMQEAHRIGELVHQAYPMMSSTLAKHAALLCLGNRETGNITADNWLDAEGADAVLWAPHWTHGIDDDDLDNFDFVPVGVLMRLSEWTNINLPLSLVCFDRDRSDADDDWVPIWQGTTAGLVANRGSDLNYFASVYEDELTPNELEAVRDAPHKNAAKRLSMIAAELLLYDFFERREQCVRGIVGLAAEAFGGIGSILFKEEISQIEREDGDCDNATLIKEFYDELGEGERGAMTIEDFTERLEDFMTYSEPLSTDEGFLKALMNEVMD